MNREKIIMCWSGGKDSTMALHTIMEQKKYDVVALLTTLTDAYDRISMHGVRRTLLEQQAASIGIPLHKVFITNKATNKEYEERMEAALKPYREKGITKVGFGDIFLEDLKIYRENNLKKIDMEGVFPIWKQDTTELVNRFIKLGYKATVTCVNTKQLDASFSGRPINEEFVRDLPSSVDPCGENGEFHSFVGCGPLYNNEVQYRTGEKVMRDSFCFTDLTQDQGEKVYV